MGDGLRGVSLDMVAPIGAYSGHMGVLYGAAGGSDIHYSFRTYPWFILAVLSPHSFQYYNGQANTSEMFGEVRWNWQNYLGSGENGFTISFDFYHEGWRYGGTINNTSIGYPVWMCGYGIVFPFTGTYSGMRTNALGPPTRESYFGRGNGNGFGVP